MENKRVAVILVNYNMPERADALADYLKDHSQWPYDLFLVDNGSDQVPEAANTTVRITRNRQTTGGWLAGLDAAAVAADKAGQSYLAYMFLITSAEFVQGDPIAECARVLVADPNAVGVHPALTVDSTTSWMHMLTRQTAGQIRQTWMIDNIASMYRAAWFDSIGWFDPRLTYAWGIDLETCYLARHQGRGLWITETAKVRKITDIGYRMGRMGMAADTRQLLASNNMREVLSEKYGVNWWQIMTQQEVRDAWR